MPDADPDLFRAAVEAAAAAVGRPVARWHPAGVVVAGPAGGEEAVNLVHLARRAKAAPEADWPALAEDFLRVVLAADTGVVPALADAAGRLRVRVGRPFPAGAAWQEPIPGTDLAVSLVVDGDRHMTYVTAGDIARSGRPADDWTRVAAANLRAATPAGWLGAVHAESGIAAGNAGDGYDAARAAVLAAVAPAGPAGYFVAVPARDWVFALAVTPAAVPHLGVLHAAAGRSFAADPYPISPRVYWVRPGGSERPWGGWEVVTLAEAAGGVRLDPSAELAAALDRA